MKFKHSFIFILFLVLLVFCQPVLSQPYVLLISFDGFRWDYLDRGITPNIDKLINKGVRAISLRPVFPSKTFPNHVSIATGLYPEHHGIIHNYFKNPTTNEEFSLSKRKAAQNPKWYSGEFIWETARKQGVISASFFWPGSELTAEYRQPNYYKEYQHELPYEKRIEGVLDWLKLPMEKRPHFITLYFHETDSKGHDYGPNSVEINNAIKLLDSLLRDLVDGIEKLSLKDSVNIIIVSDHGMTEIYENKIINIEKLLGNKKAELWETGPVMMVDPREDGIYELLKENSDNFYVYKKNEIPDFYFYSDHPFIYPIILIAKPGYSLERNLSTGKKEYSISVGNHGFEKDLLDMHGIFVASGPAFKVGYKTGTVWNIDIYPLICKILNIKPNQPIDGKLERIGFVLKEQ
jgi:ectonucleotide pyrophosphatase/phosphodiesterase family member 5